MIEIIQLLYYIVLFSMFLMSLFIAFHIVAYSYGTASKLTTLAIFVPVAGVLMVTNFLLFSNLPLARIFSGMLP